MSPLSKTKNDALRKFYTGINKLKNEPISEEKSTSSFLSEEDTDSEVRLP